MWTSIRGAIAANVKSKEKLRDGIELGGDHVLKLSEVHDAELKGHHISR